MIRTLNLDPNFDPYHDLRGGIQHEMIIFSGGELHIKIRKDFSVYKVDKIVITQRANSSDAIMAILVAVDALKRIGIKRFDLVMPYIPYARQDRYDLNKHFGESFTLKMFAEIINSIGFERVYVLDAHSEVSLGLINNSCEIKNHEFVDMMLIDIFNNDTTTQFNLIAVDAGASKKIDELATYLYSVGWMNLEIVQCVKKRDIQSGRIDGFKIYADDLNRIPSVLVDDICDGGASYIYAAKELHQHNSGDIFGFVSHGIFSKGYDDLRNYFTKMYTTDSVNDIDNPFIIQFKFTI